MPQDTTLSVPSKNWLLVTPADVTALSFQILSGSVLIKCTVGENKPTNLLGAKGYGADSGELGVALSVFSPGVVGANRVYMYGEVVSKVVVSNA